jgi:hypothetical protein
VKEAKLLTTGSYLVHLYKENGSPFIKAGSETFVMFNEVSAQNHYSQGAHVYKVDKGSLALIYTSLFAFDRFERSDSGALVLVEKEYDDNKNRYPTELKPYYSHFYTYQGGKFVETNKTHTDPNAIK